MASRTKKQQKATQPPRHWQKTGQVDARGWQGAMLGRPQQRKRQGILVATLDLTNIGRPLICTQGLQRRWRGYDKCKVDVANVAIVPPANIRMYTFVQVPPAEEAGASCRGGRCLLQRRTSCPVQRGPPASCRGGKCICVCILMRPHVYATRPPPAYVNLGGRSRLDIRLLSNSGNVQRSSLLRSQKHLCSLTNRWHRRQHTCCQSHQ
jgi:hypothetical protein